MAKRKIRLTESQLIDLIKKSMVSEQAPIASTSISLDDSTLREIAGRIVDLMEGDVENSHIEELQTILEDEVFGNLSAKTGKCAYKQLNKFYVSKEAESNPTFGSRGGGYGSLLLDVKEVSVSTESVKNDLIDAINQEMNGYCKTVETPLPVAQQQTTQTSKFSCIEQDLTYRAYGTAPNQYAEVQWKGGTLQFYLDGRDLGDGAPVGNNILYQKGGKKWTTKGECSDGGPGKQRGLILGTWTAKTN